MVIQSYFIVVLTCIFLMNEDAKCFSKCLLAIRASSFVMSLLPIKKYWLIYSNYGILRIFYISFIHFDSYIQIIFPARGLPLYFLNSVFQSAMLFLSIVLFINFIVMFYTFCVLKNLFLHPDNKDFLQLSEM